MVSMPSISDVSAGEIRWMVKWSDEDMFEVLPVNGSAKLFDPYPNGNGC